MSEPLVVLPSDPRAKHRRPWYLQGRIQVGGNPFASVGLDWCPRCQSEEECDTDAEMGQDTYVYRRRCCRCGKVIKWGCCAVTMLSERPLPEVAMEWCLEPGKDRR